MQIPRLPWLVSTVPREPRFILTTLPWSSNREGYFHLEDPSTPIQIPRGKWKQVWNSSGSGLEGANENILSMEWKIWMLCRKSTAEYCNDILMKQRPGWGKRNEILGARHAVGRNALYEKKAQVKVPCKHKQRRKGTLKHGRTAEVSHSRDGFPSCWHYEAGRARPGLLAVTPACQ